MRLIAWPPSNNGDDHHGHHNHDDLADDASGVVGTVSGAGVVYAAYLTDHDRGLADAQPVVVVESKQWVLLQFTTE